MSLLQRIFRAGIWFGSAFVIARLVGFLRLSVLAHLLLPDDFGLMAYDPGYSNTAACKSTVTYIDGDKGILLYRGYPIAVLRAMN